MKELLTRIVQAQSLADRYGRAIVLMGQIDGSYKWPEFKAMCIRQEEILREISFAASAAADEPRNDQRQRLALEILSKILQTA